MKTLPALLILCASLAAQPPQPPSNTVVSPEVNPDGRITFRLLAPKASAVTLRGEWMGAQKPLELTKDEKGVWSVTTEPVKPDLYWYSFDVDGVKTIDPRNAMLKTGARSVDSAVDVPGEAAGFQALKQVPHGTVHIEQYRSSVAGKLRRIHVYTPPGYETGKQKYPVLYLLHGSGDTDREWSAYGRANLISDNLIAAGGARPMIIVMTDGHIADMADPAQRSKNTAMFAEDLTGSVMPFVEGKYRIDGRREKRALAGLSMGGGQTLYTGLRNLDRFAWLGVFSMGVRGEAGAFEKEHAAVFSKPAETNRQLRLFWIGCGKDDFLYQSAINLHNILEKNGIQHSWQPSEGAHTWPVWRRYLREFLPQIFTVR